MCGNASDHRANAAVAAMTEFERAPLDDPETYADIHYPGGGL